MLLAVVLASTLLLCSVASQGCPGRMVLSDVDFLVRNLQDHLPSSCNCSTNVTSCLCLPIPSENCSTPCFQEGLSQVANSTAHTGFSLIFRRVNKTVANLKTKCPLLSCEQPCKPAKEDNTLAFLRTLLGVLQQAARRRLQISP
ncbi:interleukin-9 [Ochotona princeps]|uniref:interleukin-9 n=1 Tax=Ochotona princeps TaxID=9978 RepID=UPI002715229B|nr:interleukin-9 [Ochotona princeps]